MDQIKQIDQAYMINSQQEAINSPGFRNNESEEITANDDRSKVARQRLSSINRNKFEEGTYSTLAQSHESSEMLMYKYIYDEQLRHIDMVQNILLQTDETSEAIKQLIRKIETLNNYKFVKMPEPLDTEIPMLKRNSNSNQKDEGQTQSMFIKFLMQELESIKEATEEMKAAIRDGRFEELQEKLHLYESKVGRRTDIKNGKRESDSFVRYTQSNKENMNSINSHNKQNQRNLSSF